MTYTLSWLQARFDQGERIKYLMFWGHRPTRDGQVDASCLSQWYERPFVVDGLTYPTAEHWMMAEKARLFGDEERLAAILAAKSPGEAKELGRQVRAFDQETWEAARVGIVEAGNRHKFGQHADLQAYLLGSQARVLVEASPRDHIWGIGLSQDDPRAENPYQWEGLNLLGFALMTVRDAIEWGEF